MRKLLYVTPIARTLVGTHQVAHAHANHRRWICWLRLRRFLTLHTFDSQGRLRVTSRLELAWLKLLLSVGPVK